MLTTSIKPPSWLERALVLTEPELANEAVSAVSAMGFPAWVDRVLAPALTELGRASTADALDSGSLAAVWRRLAASARQAAPKARRHTWPCPKAAVLVSPGDAHTLFADLMARWLASEGYDVIDLHPMDLDSCRFGGEQPKLVVVSATLTSEWRHLPSLLRSVRSSAPGASIYVAGSEARNYRVRRLPEGAVPVESFSQMAEILRQKTRAARLGREGAAVLSAAE